MWHAGGKDRKDMKGQKSMEKGKCGRRKGRSHNQHLYPFIHLAPGRLKDWIDRYIKKDGKKEGKG